jgi:ferredoxin
MQFINNVIMQNRIDQSNCKNCGICSEVCPNKIIGRNGSIYFKEEREHLCLQCGQCMAVCSTKSVHIKGLSYDNDFNELLSNKRDYKNFIEILSSRRSVRNFKNRPVSEELIDKIRFICSLWCSA